MSKPAFRVWLAKRGVMFSIGNQGFTLAHTTEDPSDPEVEEERKWMAEQLERALEKLTCA